MDMDISMDIHAKSVDMDMDMDGKFHIHGNPAFDTPYVISYWWSFGTVSISGRFRDIAL